MTTSNINHFQREPSQIHKASHLVHLYQHNNQLINFTSDSRNNHHSNESQDAPEFTMNLLLRFINETFLSLPIKNCRNVTQVRVLSEQNDKLVIDSLAHKQQQQQQHYVYDACSVNWAQAKLVQDPANKLNYSRFKTREFLLSNLFNANSFLKHDNNPIDIDLLSTTFAHLNDTDTKPFQTTSEFNLARLTYLSISSILSICGIFINLFIILIIIFNTKQKRTTLIRSSKTGLNSVLLTQLTLTGLIIASYVLIDNINIQNDSDLLAALQQGDTNYDTLHNFDRIHNKELESKFRGPIVNQLRSPLSAFLPPTPFDSGGTLTDFLTKTKVTQANGYQNYSRHQNVANDIANSAPEQNDEDEKQRDVLLVLMFSEKAKEDNRGQELESLYLHNTRETRSDLINLSGSLRSIYIANSDCSIPYQGHNRNIRYSSVHSQKQEHSFDRKISYLNSNLQYEDFFYLRPAGLVSLLVNVIAFVHIWTVAALAYDRYCAIAHPLQYLRTIHASRTRLFLFISWAISLTLNLFLPLTINQFHRTESIYNCAGNLAETTVNGGWYYRSPERMDEDSDFELIDSSNGQNSNNKSAIFMKECRITESILADYGSESNSLKSTDLIFDQLKSFWLTSIENQTDHNNTSSESTLLIKSRINSLTVEIATLLAESSSRLFWSNSFDPNLGSEIKKEYLNENLHIALLLTFSIFSFVIIILVPLLIITICNISIYRIVKVHERRLSVSSGSNVGTSASSLNNQRHNNSRGDGLDDCKDSNSRKETLWNWLIKAGRFESHLKEAATHEVYDYYKSYGRQDKLSHEGAIESNSNIVNRSKRLITRQDSYQILEKLAHEPVGQKKVRSDDKQVPKFEGCLKKQVSTSCDSIIFKPFSSKHKTKIKRKTSDHTPKITIGEELNTPQFDYLRNRRFDLDVENCSIAESPVACNLDQFNFESGSIISQLKLAGLSFAGIAIQEPTFFNNKPLRKSTSCSLGNLYMNQHCNNCNSNNYNGSSISRCSETSSTALCPKRSYVYLNSTSSSKRQPNKHCTKLIDTSVDTMHRFSGPNINLQHNHNRLPISIGTKSAAFNVVIWLILTMLIFTLPDYLLITVNQVIKLNSSNNLNEKTTEVSKDTPKIDQRLQALVSLVFDSDINQDTLDFITKSQQVQDDSSDRVETHHSFLQIGSIWLSCLCRILFLSMVPLNGWLYGIRSRLLRSKIRMVLKKYISRRQASIEISHRQRSILSVKSADSSSMNLAPSYYTRNSSACTCFNYQNYPNRKDRVFRRCSSFQGTRNDNRLLSKSPKNLYENTDGCVSENSKNPNTVIESKDNPASINTIRFIIGDYNARGEIENSPTLSPTISTNHLCSSQETSAGSSLTSSSRSLRSSSIHSSQLSNAHSLFNQKRFENSQNLLKYTSKTKQSSLDDLEKKSEFGSSSSILRNLHGHYSADSKCPLGFISSKPNVEGEMNKQSRDPVSNRTDSNLISNQHSHIQLEKDFEFSSDSGLSRESAIDSTSGLPNFKIHEDRHKSQVKRSASDFKFIITGTDQDQHHVLQICNEPEKDSSTVRYDGTIRYDIPREESNNLSSNSQSHGLVNSWWLQLRLNLTRLLVSSSSNIITNNFLEKKSRYANGVNLAKRRCRESSSEPELDTQDQSRVALLRRSSIDNDNTMRSWHHKQSSNYSGKKRLRTSVTLNNIESNVNGLSQCSTRRSSFHADNNCYHKPHGFSSVTDQQNSTYLKPPNFLNLIFDSSNLSGPYLGPSVLSPIKECSANHSYASSQSSISNGYLFNVQQNRNSSGEELNSTKSTIVKIQKGVDNKIETKLVKDNEDH